MHLTPHRPQFSPASFERFRLDRAQPRLKRRIALYASAGVVLTGTWLWGSQNATLIEQASADELARDGQTLSAARASALASWELPASEFIRRGIAFDEAGKRALAIQVLEQATRAHPTTRDAQLQLGYLYLKEARYSEAEPVLQRALALDPVYPYTHELLAHLLAAQGDQNGATAALTKAKLFEKVPNPTE